MAKKMCFMVDNNSYKDLIIDFEYIKGLAFSQKQKNVLSFHKSIKELFPGKNILEVSSKSFDDIGRKCSAFNLKIAEHSFESIFQSSKVFEGNIRYEFLKDYMPLEAKHYIRNNVNSNLIGFEYQGEKFPTTPKSFFYDYLYIKALVESEIDKKELMNYQIFTDIEFNEKKQYNCQARAVCIYVALQSSGKLERALSSPQNFKEIVYRNEQHEQIKFEL